MRDGKVQEEVILDIASFAGNARQPCTGVREKPS